VRLPGFPGSPGFAVFRLVHGAAEASDGSAEITAHVAQFFGAEQNQHDEKYEQQLGNTYTHDGTPDWLMI